MAHISVVIPVYKAEGCLEELYRRLKVSLEAITTDFEIVLVEDCGGDRSWPIIVDLAHRDNRVKGIQLSRNFGQHYAITAGLDHADGDWIVVMDCDLQDQPEELGLLYRKAQEGYDIVVGRRAFRQDGKLKKLGSILFYKIFNYFTGNKIDNRIGNFGIYSSQAIHNIRALREQNRSFGLFAIWVGFRRLEIDVVHAPRMAGESSYSFQKLVTLALDSIVAHSNKLLHLTVNLGFLMSLGSLMFSAWLAISYFFSGYVVAGWTSLMISIFFTTGLVIASVGIVGLYIGKIFDEVKERPLYIIASKTNSMGDFP